MNTTTQISDDEARSFYVHAERGKQVDLEGEGVKYSVIQPHDLQRFACTVTELRHEVARLQGVIATACEIIERGDERLLADDGPIGNQPPRLTLKEWGKLYRILDKALPTIRRSALRRRASPKSVTKTEER